MAYRGVFTNPALLNHLEQYTGDCLTVIRVTLISPALYFWTGHLWWEYRLALDAWESCLLMRAEEAYWEQEASAAVHQWALEYYPEEFYSGDD